MLTFGIQLEKIKTFTRTKWVLGRFWGRFWLDWDLVEEGFSPVFGGPVQNSLILEPLMNLKSRELMNFLWDFEISSTSWRSINLRLAWVTNYVKKFLKKWSIFTIVSFYTGLWMQHDFNSARFFLIFFWFWKS